jgi:hypothetical protein
MNKNNSTERLSVLFVSLKRSMVVRDARIPAGIVEEKFSYCVDRCMV